MIAPSTSAPSASRPLAVMVGLILATLVASLGLMRALERAFDAAPQVYAHPARWSNHGNTLWITGELARRDRPALLFAGSSTTRTAIDERIVEELTGGAYYVENISNSTTDPAGIYYWLRWLAERRPEALPDILVQGIEELELQDEYAYHAFHSHLTRFFADYEILDTDPLFAEAMQDPARRRDAWLESAFPLYARRALVSNLVVGRLVWPFYDAGWLQRAWLPRFHLRPYDWNYFRVARESTLERREQGLARLGRDGSFNRERYRFPNTQTAALRRIAELCAELGIAHYAVVMPGVPEKFDDELPPDLIDEMSAAIRGAYEGTATRVVWAWHFLRGEDFFDSLHINQYGRGPLTRLVTERILTDQGERGLGTPYRRTGREGALPPPVTQHETYALADRARYWVEADADRRRSE